MKGMGLRALLCADRAAGMGRNEVMRKREKSDSSLRSEWQIAMN
jgi:hypothetical protein